MVRRRAASYAVASSRDVVRSITFGVLAAFAIGACSTSPGSSSTGATPADHGTTVPAGTSAAVARVLDGDSLVVTLDSEEREVRLIGINAPEGSECFGDEARTSLEQLAGTGPVILVADGEETDQYGRLLRYLFVDGLNINRELLARGAAIVLQGEHSANAEFAATSDRAATNGRGLWAPDACGTTVAMPSVVVADYVYDPGGRDEDNLNEEWVGLENQGSAAQDMTGWILRDESTQNRYVFPAGFTLAAHATVVIHSGCGTDTATDLHWCTEIPVWSNGGDTVILELANGTVVARSRYSGQ